MHLPLLLLWALASITVPTSAQFQFFEQMFQGGGSSSSQQQQHPQQQQQPNVPSDSEWYQRNHEAAHCSNYLCPHTLSCVHFPHHCPCAFPAHEDKVELGDGSAVCVSKGGFVPREVARKVGLARKGLL